MLLRRFLQLQTNKSRRTIFDLVKDGKISVNDNCVDDFKYVLKDGDVIEINDGKRVTHSFHSSQTGLDRVVVLFNKPSGCVVSKSDQYNETIFKYFPSGWEKDFYYVGRLDKNSRGLLLLVNDPHLVHKFEHPSHNHTKTYYVTVKGGFNKSDIVVANNGLFVDHDGVIDEKHGEMLYAGIDVISFNSNATILRVTLSYGKNRHIRRLLSALGYVIEDLNRTNYGPFYLGNIPSGNYITRKFDSSYINQDD